jgi:hypothetical protein
MQFSQRFLRKDATKHIDIRGDELIRETTIYAKIALLKNRQVPGTCRFLLLFN